MGLSLYSPVHKTKTCTEEWISFWDVCLPVSACVSSLFLAWYSERSAHFDLKLKEQQTKKSEWALKQNPLEVKGVLLQDIVTFRFNMWKTGLGTVILCNRRKGGSCKNTFFEAPLKNKKKNYSCTNIGKTKHVCDSTMTRHQIHR